jgi:hypothetical protein
MFARRLTSSAVTHTSLNTPPDVEVQTLDDYYKIITDAGEALLKKKIQTTESLIDHLQAVALITHINMTAENKKLEKHCDTALLAANFQEIKPPLSVAGALRTMVTAPPAALITRSTRSSHSQGAATGPLIICFHYSKPGHTVPNCPTKKTTTSLHLAEKRKAAYILARDARRTVRAAENRENAESALLAMAESVPAIQYDTDTDNEQDEDEDDEI